MNDKRDEVIKQIEEMWDGLEYDDSSIGPTADLILSREAELRAEIADELDKLPITHHAETSVVLLRPLWDYIEKLRGNK